MNGQKTIVCAECGSTREGMHYTGCHRAAKIHAEKLAAARAEAYGEPGRDEAAKPRANTVSQFARPTAALAFGSPQGQALRRRVLLLDAESARLSLERAELALQQHDELVARSDALQDRYDSADAVGGFVGSRR